jgi:phospholipase/lecithinase/hemolysin
MEQTKKLQRKNLLRASQVALAGAAFALLTACGGGSSSSPSSTPSGGVKLQVVSFGDSLSDVGTYSPVILASFGGGRFTTNPGQIWTQNVAQYYGDTLTPAYLGGFGQPLAASSGLGYAQGGSRVTQQPGLGHAPSNLPDYAQATTVPVATQVQQYLSAKGSFNSNQLVLINGGADDIFYNVQAAAAAGNTPAAQLQAAQAIGLAAQQLGGVVQQILAAGATHVVLMNVPDIGGSPQAVSTGTQAAFTQLSGIYNQALVATLQALGIYNKVIFIDAFSWGDKIAANFQANGFTVSNTGTACNLKAMVTAATAFGAPMPAAFGSSLFCSPDTYTVPGADQTYMFADTVHPTTHLNALFAQYVEQQIAASGLGH